MIAIRVGCPKAWKILALNRLRLSCIVLISRSCRRIVARHKYIRNYEYIGKSGWTRPRAMRTLGQISISYRMRAKVGNLLSGGRKTFCARGLHGGIGKVAQIRFALAKEVGAQFVVLQVIDRQVEKYSLVFSVALLAKWRFGRSIPTIPVDSLQREESIDLAAVVQRVVMPKLQGQVGAYSISDGPVKILAVTFRGEEIDIVIFELGKRLPFPYRVAVELLMLVKRLPYPVLLSGCRED